MYKKYLDFGSNPYQVFVGYMTWPPYIEEIDYFKPGIKPSNGPEGSHVLLSDIDDFDFDSIIYDHQCGGVSCQHYKLFGRFLTFDSYDPDIIQLTNKYYNGYSFINYTFDGVKEYEQELQEVGIEIHQSKYRKDIEAFLPISNDSASNYFDIDDDVYEGVRKDWQKARKMIDEIALGGSSKEYFDTNTMTSAIIYQNSD